MSKIACFVNTIDSGTALQYRITTKTFITKLSNRTYKPCDVKICVYNP